MKTVICLSGGIASGKTTIAQALAERFPNVTVRSFGDVICQQARPLTGPHCGPWLSLVHAGWPAFVDALLEDVPQSVDVLIIDGYPTPRGG